MSPESSFFWSLSLIVTIFISFHVLIMISLHLIRRFIRKDCKSKIDSEIFRTIYGYCTLIFSYLSLCLISSSNQKGIEQKTSSIKSCRNIIYLGIIFETLIQWSLISFLLTKVKVSQNILNSIGMTPKNKYLILLIISNIICILYLIISLIINQPKLSKITLNGVTIIECGRDSNVIAVIFQFLICILQIISTYLFLYPLYQIYKQSCYDSETTCIDLNFDNSLDQIKDLLKANTFWGIISIIFGQIMIIIIYILYPYIININVGLFFIIFNFLIQNFVMVRLIGWQDIYAKYFKYCCKICHYFTKINNIDESDNFGYYNLNEYGSMTPTMTGYEPPQMPQFTIQ